MPPIYYVYIAILLVAVLSVIVSIMVNSKFKKYSQVYLHSGLTAEQIVKKITTQGGAHVNISRVAGHLSDHYDPRDNTVYLSDSTSGSSSVSAIGVAAHEAGHALKENQGYLFLKLRSWLVPVVNFSSRWAIFIILIGFLFSGVLIDSVAGATVGDIILTIGIVMYSLVTLFTLITLPVEFNASRRAIRALGDYMDDEELRGVKTVLTCAALTYVVSFAGSLLQLLRIIMIFGRRRR